MYARVSTLVLSFSLFASAQSLFFDFTTIPTGVTPQSLVVGDFNHDGKPDLAVTGSEGSVEILFGNGDGTFRSGQTIPVGAPATRIVKADFNHDGNPDLAVSVGSNGQVTILLGDSDGTFKAPFDSGARAPTGPFTPSNNPTVLAGDINGDGKLDLILGPYSFADSTSSNAASTTTMYVLLGNGDGTFQTPVMSTIDPVTFANIAPVDFYNNGKTELFLIGEDPPNPPTGLITGGSDGKVSTTWFTSQPTGYDYAFFAMTVADVNGNGRPDVVVLAPYTVPAVYTYLDGNFTPVTSAPNLGAMNGLTQLAAADMNGDGKPDLVVLTAYGQVYVVPGKGDGTFLANAARPFYAGVPPTFSPGALQPGADVFGSLSTADFRSAGKQDVIFAFSGKSVVLLKNGAGTPPEIAPGGVLSAASLTPIPAVAGSLVSIFGSAFAYYTGATPGASPGSAAFSPFGSTVTVNGMSAPFLWLSPTQANVQIPWEAAGLTQATLVFTKNGMASPPVTIQLAPYSPALFTMSGEGTGQAAALIVGPNSIAAPVGAFAASRPAHPGEYVAFWGTGLGPVIEPDIVYTGLPPNTYDAFLYYVPYTYPTTQPATATVGGVPATVEFSGLAPGTAGAYQINVLIPSNAPSGSAIPVVVSIGGVPSPAVTIAIGGS